MKKFATLLIIFLFVQSFCLYAQYYPNRSDPPEVVGDKKTENKKTDNIKAGNTKAENKKPLDIQDRSFEFGLAHINMNFANNLLSMSEVFQDVIVINIDKISDGIMFNLGFGVTPFYFSYESKKGWGFGISTDIEGVGILGLSGTMLTFSEAVKENSDISGALFTSTTVNTFFNMQKFKVKINPSLYYALACIAPLSNSPSSLMYTMDYSNGTVMCIDYAVRIYTCFPLDDDGFQLTSKPGLDFSVGIEYPLSKEIGLNKIMPFLDFDVGFDLINIPIISSTMTDYRQIKGRVGSDKPITFFGNDDENFFSSFDANNELESGKDEINVSRPFKMIAWAYWRPINGKKLFTITPVIGFCHNNFYYNPFSLEAGLNVCLNLANFFLIKAGINYTDRMFVNSLGLALNFRVFELDIGADLRSQDANQSWKGAGVGVNFGLKLGW